jgi:CoA binding domain
MQVMHEEQECLATNVEGGACERTNARWLFRPRNVAVIGATERPGTVGRAILGNPISSPFGGAVLPVNPKHASVIGIKAYPSIREATGEADLAVETQAHVQGRSGICKACPIRTGSAPAQRASSGDAFGDMPFAQYSGASRPAVLFLPHFLSCID